MCRALGGKVGKAYSGWDIGVRKVEIVKDLCFQFLGDDDNNLEETSPSLSIIEVHQDEVYMHNNILFKDILKVWIE